MVRFLSRTELLALTGDSVDRFDSKVRSGNVPKLQKDAQGRKRGKYTPLEALLFIMANELTDAQHLAPRRAAEIASQAFIIASQMKGIAKTSDEYSRGVMPKADIFFALALNPSADGSLPKVIAACGTMAQVARKFPSPVRIDLINVSRSAAVMRARAHRADIDLQEFWKV